ncbi:hypothetical protein SAMN05421837_102756 [Amycolatopsis pretoriensis]|uniref:Uncharacterized protein n=1 Tax=Amycolatopsis pretoriensis TaxID=218821 RepID=A0A1H5QEH5_9PSEU|nr:hypothetical protein [Amycolatopsis pretoriensis]SEF24532.1 hypothetical protein SAMN05421837_102756 [Amycolatopsis pretoriensis]
MLDGWSRRKLGAGDHPFGRIVGVLIVPLVKCMYDISRYRENIVFDLIKTHPQVLMCGVLMENPYYLSPASLA